MGSSADRHPSRSVPVLLGLVLLTTSVPGAPVERARASVAGYTIELNSASAALSPPGPRSGERPDPAPLRQCTPGKHSRFWASSGWLNLGPGQEADSWAEWQNVGCETWGSNLRLGTWNPIPGQDQPSQLGGAALCPTATNWSTCNRIAPSYTPVGYGQIVRFTFRIRAPAARGTYFLYVRPLIEGELWLEDEGVYWQHSVRLYNRTAAVTYADTWTSNTDAGQPKVRNPDYPDFGSDCQNYVSQVLYAGGMPETFNRRFDACYYTDWFRPERCLLCPPYFFRWTHSWSVADCQRQFFSYYSDYFSLQFWQVWELQAGDVLHMDNEMAGYPTHSRVMVGAGIDSVDGQWYLNLFNQHTNDRKHRRWFDGLPADSALWKWHVEY
jgi:putative amidase-like protein